jgi:hypothetical protein
VVIRCRQVMALLNKTAVSWSVVSVVCSSSSEATA